jgi:GNAT superfamily N-acetyltransferase
MAYEIKKGDYLISDDKLKLDVSLVHNYLSKESYWAQNIPKNVVKKSIENSISFGVYHGKDQVGFARVITDRATFAYLADVFIIEKFRGLGLSKWLIESIHQHPDLQGLRRWMLATRDAFGLYEKYGWKLLAAPERFMEISVKDPYLKKGEDEV